MKAGGAASGLFTDIDELDRQMSAIEKAAGIKARYEELQGHIKARVGCGHRGRQAGRQAGRPAGRTFLVLQIRAGGCSVSLS